MDSKKLKKRKKQASKPKRMSIFEELNRPVTYILDDVKETIVTENTYKAMRNPDHGRPVNPFKIPLKRYSFTY